MARVSNKQALALVAALAKEIAAERQVLSAEMDDSVSTEEALATKRDQLLDHMKMQFSQMVDSVEGDYNIMIGAEQDRQRRLRQKLDVLTDNGTAEPQSKSQNLHNNPPEPVNPSKE